MSLENKGLKSISFTKDKIQSVEEFRNSVPGWVAAINRRALLRFGLMQGDTKNRASVSVSNTIHCGSYNAYRPFEPAVPPFAQVLMDLTQ